MVVRGADADRSLELPVQAMYGGIGAVPNSRAHGGADPPVSAPRRSRVPLVELGIASNNAHDCGTWPGLLASAAPKRGDWRWRHFFAGPLTFAPVTILASTKRERPHRCGRSREVSFSLFGGDPNGN